CEITRLKENMQGVNHLTKVHGKSTRDNVAGNVPQFESDMCVKEFLALKHCMCAPDAPNLCTQYLPWPGKALVERENVGFDFTKFDLYLSFVEDHTAKSMGLCVADSHTSNHREDGFTPLETIRRFLGITVSRSLSISKGRPSSRRGGSGHMVPKAVTKPITHIKEMDFRSFIIEGIDGEFHFEPEGGVGDGEGSSPSIRSVNNEAPVIDHEPHNSAPPSQFAENIRDSNDAPSKNDVVDEARNRKLGKSSKATRKRKHIAESSGRETRQKSQKVPPQASKTFDDPSDSLNVDSDPDSHEFPSAKELKDSADCHWVVAHAVLDNMLNNRTHKLISTLAKARASCDAIRVREKDKDKAYAELEMRCNKALQVLDKNPLVLDMCEEIETLRGQVDKLHGEYIRLVLEEKKWINYEQTLVILC
ncbi:hypothetical protein Tco_1116246, partial [Tanacetum coccineum]